MSATELHISKNNPYFAELKAISSELNSIHLQRKADQSLLDAKLTHRPEEDQKRIAELQEQIQTKNVSVLTALPFYSSTFLGRLFDPFGARRERERLEEARELQERIDREKADLQKKIDQMLAHGIRVAGIDEYKQRALIRTADCQIELMSARQASIKARSDVLLQQFGDLIQSADALDVDILELEQGLADATRLDASFATVPPNKRYEIHNKCADRFHGETSPRKVINALRRKLEGASRQKDKVSKKILEEVRKLQVVIKRVFIDGNNLTIKQAHNSKVFIGTAAIEALATELLAKGYAVTVVFDQKIGTGDQSITFQRALQNFEAAVQVEQAPPRTPADELLMAFANEDTDCILSNDRFMDYGHKKLVKDKRVLSVLISDQVVAVPFLNLEVPYSVPGAAWS